MLVELRVGEQRGFVTVRHENIAVVRAALDRIISELRVELVEAG